MLAATLLTARLDVQESIRARWFFIAFIVFAALSLLLIGMGLTESRVLGFTGLSRLLVTFTQIVMAVLPLFVLVTTVRSLVGDRETGAFEYLLSFPTPLEAWYWGKFAGRFLMIAAPVLTGFALAVGYGVALGFDVPWGVALYDVGLMLSLIICFLGLAFLISSVTRSTELALGLSLAVWLILLAFMDLVLIGVLIRENFAPELIVGVALANPMQSFRTASMLVYDEQLMLLGPAAYVLLDAFGPRGYMIWALAYPAGLGVLAAGIGYARFRSTDLV